MYDIIAVMNNDDMPLSVYGLRPGCFISLKLDKSNKNHHKEVGVSESVSMALILEGTDMVFCIYRAISINISINIKNKHKIYENQLILLQINNTNTRNITIIITTTSNPLLQQMHLLVEKPNYYKTYK